MKNTLIFFVLLISLCAPALGLTCSNVKIQVSGTSMNDKITCDSISDFEVSPELSFLTIIQSVNSIHISGDISGRNVTGFIRIYGQYSVSSGQFDIRDAIRVPVIINAGSTPTPTPTHTLTIQTTIPTTTHGTTIPTTNPSQKPSATPWSSTTPTTKPTYTPIPAVIVTSSIAGAILLWKRLYQN